jgi:aryl-alcohol dehydrogenase-like predicted oxidoreductase
MNLRPLGATGIQVTEVGLGAWQLANPDWHLHDKQEALNIVRESLDLGCNFFDTAPGYGGGRSEELLGQALKSVRPDVVICTKFAHHAENGAWNFEVGAIRSTLEESLRRLQTDYVDVLLMHNPPKKLMDGNHAPHYEVFEKLQAEGKIRAYGVSLDWCEEVETVIHTTGSRAIEVFFNAFYQEPLPAFKAAHEKGVGLIVKVPLDSGWLSGKYRGQVTFEDVRKRWPPEVIARRAELVEKFADLVPAGTSLTQAALRYTLAYPEVSTVIPGAKSVAQARENFLAAGQALPDEVVRAIEALWESDIAANPLPW